MRQKTTPAAPRLPETIDTTGSEIETDGLYERLAFDNTDLIGIFAQGVEIAECRFRAARLAGAVLPKVRLTDCVVERSDWSNTRAENGALERVTVTGCRMTGLAWGGGLVKDVTFTDCKLDLTAWRFARFDAVTISDCNLSGADFTNTDLRGARFVGCDLTGAQFSNATMRGTRFQRCELTGIGGITSWAGAIVDPDDLIGLSYALAGALGITVSKS